MAIEHDTIQTAEGSLVLSFVGHGSLMLDWGGQVIHVDPVSTLAEYQALPQADVIFITHSHADHLDFDAVKTILTATTHVVTNPESGQKLKSEFGGIIGAELHILSNGEALSLDQVGIEAVPAYNTSPGRDKFHPRGRDNGYVLTLGSTRVYVAGDTENIPEQTSLKDIDIAFLPMNQPYTMTPEQAAAAAKTLRAGIIYPYHFGDTDPNRLAELLQDESEIEIRIRNLR